MNTVNSVARNEISFNFEDKVQVRTVAKNDEVWFVAADVCEALQIKNPTKALYALDDDEKMTLTLSKGQKTGRGGAQFQSVVSESGLYTLILRCRDAVKEGTVPHRVRKWVTSEVLPSIRKTGTYTMPDRLTPAQQRALQEAVTRRAGELPAEKRGMAFPKLWGGIKSHFQVGTYKDLSPAQYDAALSFIDSYEWEVLDKEMSIPVLGNSFIPEQQANEIKIRLNRVGKIFHPFSDQFIDLNGVNRLLRGLDPNLGTAEKGYVKLIEKW